MAKNMITISLEEYKELLLKEKPTTNETELLRRIIEMISSKLVYSDSSYSNDLVMENVELREPRKVWSELFTLIKYVDFQLYMKIWNGVMTKERERKQQEELVRQMHQAKQIREKNDEEV